MSETNLMTINEVEGSLSSRVHDVLEELNSNAVELKAQAERAVVDSDKSLAAAGDLHRVIRGQDKSAEEFRKDLIKPVKGWIDLVNALFKGSATDRAEAARVIKQKADAFQRQREAEARRIAEQQRREAEERALRDAAIAEAAGDTASAEVILETGAAAADDIEKGAKPGLVRGEYGATVGVRRTVRGEVEDVNAFLRAIADGKAGRWSGLISFKQSGLNALARDIDQGGEPIPGLKVEVESTTNFR